MNVTWNPWHGCHKISPGCKNCYVYRQDARYERDSSRVTKNKTFYLPIEKNKNGEYKLKREGDGIVYLCFSSDFFLEDADSWRNECWKMIKQRSELEFLFITKGYTDFTIVSPMIGERATITFISAVPVRIRIGRITDCRSFLMRL